MLHYSMSITVLYIILPLSGPLLCPPGPGSSASWAAPWNSWRTRAPTPSCTGRSYNHNTNNDNNTANYYRYEYGFHYHCYYY